jgi:hypothetical protein
VTCSGTMQNAKTRISASKKAAAILSVDILDRDIIEVALYKIRYKL